MEALTARLAAARAELPRARQRLAAARETYFRSDYDPAARDAYERAREAVAEADNTFALARGELHVAGIGAGLFHALR